MDLLIAAASQERVGAVIRAVAPHMRIITVDGSGVFAAGTDVLDPAAIDPAIAWMSVDLLLDHSRASFNRAVLASKRLKWVQTAAGGLDDPLLAQLAEKGVRLTNSDAQAPSIADFVVGNVLAHLQHHKSLRSLQAAKQWRPLSFRELGRTRWLILGYGSVGREVARRLKGFGTPVIGIRRHPREDEFADRVVAPDRLQAELPEADVVVLACPLNAETRGLVDRGFLAAMSAGSILVNVGRGALVVEADLLAALDGGIPDYAVLDVFATEPLPGDSPFWEHPRVVVASHTASFGDGMRQRSDELFLINLRRFLAGEPLHKEVNASDLTRGGAALARDHSVSVRP